MRHFLNLLAVAAVCVPLAACAEPADVPDRVSAANAESTSLTAQAAASYATTLVLASGGPVGGVDLRSEQVWAAAALDLPPSVRILDPSGTPVEASADRHDRYLVEKTFPTGVCIAVLSVTGDPGDVGEAVVVDAACG